MVMVNIVSLLNAMVYILYIYQLIITDKKDEKVSIQSTIPLHDFEGGFDSIIVETDFSSLPQSERPKRQLTGRNSIPLLLKTSHY